MVMLKKKHRLRFFLCNSISLYLIIFNELLVVKNEYLDYTNLKVQ